MSELPHIRASNMDRSLACPGSSQVAKLVGERERDDGYEGTWLHHAIARRLIDELGAIPPEGGLPPPQVPEGYKPPQMSLWIVDWAINHVKETIPSDWALMVEVEFEHVFGRWRGTGHADLIAQSPDGKRIKGKDWKCGYTPVDDAEENDQVLTYLVFCKLDWPDTEEAEFEICQPRLSYDDRVTQVTVSGAQLEACVTQLDRRVGISLDNRNLLNTGLKQCKWCVGCSCPAIQAELKHMQLTLTPAILAQIQAVPADPVLGDFVITARTLAKPIKDATEMLHERLDVQPQIVAGCGMTISRKLQRGDIKIPDPVKFMAALRVVLPEDARIAKCVSPSKGAIIDQIAERTGKPKTSKDGESATLIYDAHLAPLTVQEDKRLLVIT